MIGFYPGSIGLDGDMITVEQALNSPTRIERRIADIAEKDLLVDTVFTEGGPVEGGAVIYSQTTEKDLYVDGDIAQRTPGEEYQVVYDQEPEPQLARVEDWGSKFSVADEKRDRNDTVEFDNQVTRLTNSIVRKINRRVIDTLTAAIPVSNLLSTTNVWADTILDGDPASITPPKRRPTADLAVLIAAAEKMDLGIEYSTLLVNPDTHRDLRIVYGKDLTAVLEDLGLTLRSSNSVPVDRAFIVDDRQVGFVRYEHPLTVTTWREEATRRTWVQAYAMPSMGVTLPAALGTILLPA
jgi:hypothetical protein